ncbi:hypothetical protein EVAR_18049_1 [Eumeta japonica]|uniref:Uncharacterized protein n=1 Tax=Eumeta variegata TaxID=151549 RepID=A0A4C1XXB6_EUMVA|nr:hypothetical protein EVAR_18049_1 [Eumeta japonica]
MYDLANQGPYDFPWNITTMHKRSTSDRPLPRELFKSSLATAEQLQQDEFATKRQIGKSHKIGHTFSFQSCLLDCHYCTEKKKNNDASVSMIRIDMIGEE